MCRARWLTSFIILSLAILGCESIKGSGIKGYEGQTVLNRVSLRARGKNRVESANRFSNGVLIPPGTRCTIKAISIKEIKFIAKEAEYKLTGWRIGYGGVNTRASFYKFFTQDEETVGLDRVRAEFRESVLSGIAQKGMTKEEVLLSLGYPAYLEKKNSTTDDSRAAILFSDNWYYLNAAGEKVSLKFKAGLLSEIDLTPLLHLW